ncbi:MAG: hypothetical protein CMJ46_02640 [Planctomyces sp.]|nr:hypothetical protein [Planctomyces sp.]
MSRLNFIVVAMIFVLGSYAHAASQFPYEAVVQSETAQVRSQNSQRAAVTNELQFGDRVVVYAHQPGGWYKIVPPEGSFSLIPKSVVETRPDSFGKGIVLQNNSPAYMGSAVGELNTGVHNKLSKNDEVTILETVTLNTQRGPVEMYKIAPPAYEYRWIEGEHLVPADQLNTKQDTNPFALREEPQAYGAAPQKQDPFAQTAEAPKPKITTVVKANSEPKAPASNSKGVRRSAPPEADVEADRTALRELDLAFKEMIDLDPSEWDLNGLEAAYTELQKQTKHAAIASQVDLRLGAVTRYRKIKSEYEEFVQLTSATSQREQELSQQQQQIALTVGSEPTTIVNGEGFEYEGAPSETIVSSEQPTPLMVNPTPDGGPQFGSTPPETIVSQPAEALSQTRVISQPGGPRSQGDLISGPQGMTLSSRPSAGPQLQGPVMETSETAGPTIAAPTTPVPTPADQTETYQQPTPLNLSPHPIAAAETGMPEFDGAGIIQRTLNPRPGLPQHVLTSPEGQIISYITPRGNLNLDPYIGKSMGIQGEVKFQPELNRHVLIIDRMMPVSLTR